MSDAQRRRIEERLYPVVVIGFLVALVVAGVLGVPAPLVAGGGALFAALAILACRGFLEPDRGGDDRPATVPRSAPRQYVPRVLEAGPVRRRRGVRPRRRNHPRYPVRFR